MELQELSKLKEKIAGTYQVFVYQIEGGNIEYGNIEKCNIDSDLRSKIWRLVTSKR